MAGPLNFFLARNTFLFPASFLLFQNLKKIWTLKFFGTDTRYNEFVLDFNRVAAVVAVAAAVGVLLLFSLLLLLLLSWLLLAQRFKNSFQSV